MNSRVAAARRVLAVTRGRSLDQLDAVSGDAALVQEMVYGCLRWYVRLEGLRSILLDRPVRDKDADIGALILVGLYQLIYMRVPAHAAVSETVAGAVEMGKPWARGMINAVLRRLQRELPTLLAQLEGPDQETAHPAWLVRMLAAAWPGQWRSITAANNCRPPMCLRVNPAQDSVPGYAARLAASGIDARPLAGLDSALLLDHPVAVECLPGFMDGAVSVQDASAQLAAPLLDAGPGARVLDACAAPGGKTAHLLERCPRIGEVTALDIDPGRVERMAANLARLDLAADLRVADAAHPETWWDGQPYDRILLDAPCSASGVIRRHPDIKLLRRAGDIEKLAQRQRGLLSALWPLLRRGGKLVYATCSVLPRENTEAVEILLEREDSARDGTPDLPWGRRLATGWQTLPGEGSGDGFYYACINKT